MNSKNKKIIIIISVILILFGIYMLYNTFAVSTIASKSEDNIYDIIAGEGTTITVPKGSSKTIYLHLKNTNNSSVKYALGYNTNTNIEVKVYEDSKDKPSDIIGYTENKYIKLYLNNTSTTDNTVTITSVLGYENGGDLIVPDGITLVTEVYTPPKITEPTVVLSDYITNLYTNSEKGYVQINSITYQYGGCDTFSFPCSNGGLVGDRLGGATEEFAGGNIRYYGANTTNYIYFNCSDYSNQTSDTCELWRIIGVFDGKVKIMRNESIGEYSWDTSASDINSGNGENEWSDSTLMKLLNPGYESESVGGSLYYNSGSGKCYNGQYKATTSCDFTNTGIKNNATKNKIAEVSWPLGGVYSAEIYANEAYTNERGTEVYEGREKSWTGKIALAYASDYGYVSPCMKKLRSFSDSNSNCLNNSWMYPIVTTSGEYNSWFLTPNYGNSFYAWDVNKGGYVNTNLYGDTVCHAKSVFPTLFLNQAETIVEGNTGSINDPYKLSP